MLLAFSPQRTWVERSDRQVGWLLALENPAGLDTSESMFIGNIGSVVARPLLTWVSRFLFNSYRNREAERTRRLRLCQGPALAG